MLDEMRVLRAAIQAYREAATAAGLPWPEPADTQDAQPPELDLIYRVFDVDHVPEQLTWFVTEGWQPRWPCPVSGSLLPWPTNNDTARDSLEMLSFSVGTPFHWRHQIPLFDFSPYVYTFVFEGDHEGEIWRYLISGDEWDPVRAAPSLAALLTEWTRGIAAGVLYHRDNWLMVGEPQGTVNPFAVLRQQAPDLDPLAFPIDIPAPELRERQHEYGVDVDGIDLDLNPECQIELQDAVYAVGVSLGP